MKKKKDILGGKIGMWLFLYTEIMLFGGLFVLYAAYLSKYAQDFIEGGKELSLSFGLVNTLILLISSFLVAAAITAARSGLEIKAAPAPRLTISGAGHPKLRSHASGFQRAPRSTAGAICDGSEAMI